MEPDLILVAPTRDLGDDFRVRRALPSARRRMVGPFIFFDQMGPATFEAGRGLDVRPHPHIGLATVTYLFEGEILHRDTLGNAQRIQPGAVNWMTAGRGIAHSERTPDDLRRSGGRLSGIQLWVALPKPVEEQEPSFTHTPAAALPVFEDAGAQVRVVLGEAYGQKSPVKVQSELFYAAATLDPGARLPLPPRPRERAVYVAEGSVVCGDDAYAEGTLLLFRPGDEVSLRAAAASKVLLLGGEPADGPRHIWWNFVSSSQERIEQARADWKAARFGRIPGDDKEFIPLPENWPPPPVRYP